MKRLFAALFLLSVSATAANAQDIEKGIDAYERGDYTAALAEWLPLAEKKNAEAQFYVRLLYEDDTGRLYDQAVGTKWLKSATELGLGDAQYVLARRYVFGSGVPKDNVLAYMWLNIASGTQMWVVRNPAANFNISSANAVRFREVVAKRMSRAEIREAQRRTREWLDAHPQ